jgi:hypothetical protein
MGHWRRRRENPSMQTCEYSSQPALPRAVGEIEAEAAADRAAIAAELDHANQQIALTRTYPGRRRA